MVPRKTAWRAPRRWWLGLAGLLVLGHLAWGLGYWAYSWPRDHLLPLADDFSSGDLRHWQRLGWQQLCCAHSLRLQTDPLDATTQAARFELRRDDPPVRGSVRAELRWPGTHLQRSYRFRFRLYIPPDWAADRLPVTLVQWHSVSDKLLFEGGPSPPLRLVVIGEEWLIDNLWDPHWVTKWPLQVERNVNARLIARGALERGRWLDWEFRVFWSWQDDGRIEVFKDGVALASASGPNTYRDVVAPYMKFGLYVPRWADPQAASAVRQRVAWFGAVGMALHTP